MLPGPLADEFHHTRNHPLTAADLTPGSNKRVWWWCKEGHAYDATVSKRTAGRGCPYCRGYRVLLGFNDLATTDPVVASQWIIAKNSDLPSEVVRGSHKSVWFRCTLGHEYKAKVYHRTLSGSGCPVCSGKCVVQGFNDLGSCAPEVAREWSADRNTQSPEEVHVRSNTSYWWKCSAGHEWKTTPEKRTDGGTGCPKCGVGNQVSKPELLLWKEFANRYPNVVHSATLEVPWGRVSQAKVDILIESLRAVIEYDGEYWHTTRFETDSLKTDALIQAGYTVCRIRETPLKFLRSRPGLIQVGMLPDESYEDVVTGIIAKVHNMCTTESSASKEMN